MPTASSIFRSSDRRQNLLIAAITFNFFVVYASSDPSMSHESGGERGIRLRNLKSFKETVTDTNTTFDCSPSGPCVPCLYSEKKDDSYRCSETGYRIPMSCVKVDTQVDEENEKKQQKGRKTLENTDKLKLHVLVHNGEDPTTLTRERNLLEESSKGQVGTAFYVNYRSCIPAVNDEKISVLGFEAIMLLLLASSSFVIFRRKGTLFMPGAVRVPTNPRF